MILVISPAKSLDYDSSIPNVESTLPRFVHRSAQLIKVLRNYSVADLSRLMSLSTQLSELNVKRNLSWSPSHNEQNSRPAIFAFNGDVYEGFNAYTMSFDATAYVQKHLRILSGLYGALRPLDLLQPYRLEMGTKLSNQKGRNLYEFWGDIIAKSLNEDIANSSSKALINLASEEYFKSVNAKLISVPIISPVFLDWSSGKYKVVSFHAKRARGEMARYIVDNQVTEGDLLRHFNVGGYIYDPSDSTLLRPVFKRKF